MEEEIAGYFNKILEVKKHNLTENGAKTLFNTLCNFHKKGIPVLKVLQLYLVEDESPFFNWGTIVKFVKLEFYSQKRYLPSFTFYSKLVKNLLLFGEERVLNSIKDNSLREFVKILLEFENFTFEQFQSLYKQFLEERYIEWASS